jgi:hypothetical protein
VPGSGSGGITSSLIPGAAVSGISSGSGGCCGAGRRRAAGFLAGRRDLRAVFDAERRADFFAERREDFFAAVRLRPRVLLLLLRAFDFAFRLAIRTPFRSIHQCNGRHERGHCATTPRNDPAIQAINFERPRRDNSDGHSAELAPLN